MKSLDNVLGMEMKYCSHKDCNSPAGAYLLKVSSRNARTMLG